MKKGHIPIRQCVGCRIRRPASEMIRLKAKDHALIVVPAGTMIPGRGCYLCPDEKCIATALKKKVFTRALRQNTLSILSKESLLQGTGTKEVHG